MTFCEYCGEKISYLPFKCKYCGGTYCQKHRLPENHQCNFELKHTPLVPDTSRSLDTRYKTPKRVPREFKRYLKRQEKQRKSSKKIATKRYNQGSQFTGTKLLISLIIVMSITAAIFQFFNLSTFIYLSLYGLINNFAFYTILSSLFIIQIANSYLAFLYIFIVVFLLYYTYLMSRSIESRFGQKFLFKLFLISGLFSGLFYFLLRLAFLFILPVDDIFYSFPVGLAWGGILGLIAFSIFPVMNQQIQGYMFFFPMRISGRGFLIIIILMRILPVIISPLNALFSLPDLGGILGAYILYKSQLKNNL